MTGPNTPQPVENPVENLTCPVHPHRTGGEVKSIGLIRREGETYAECYSRWAMRRGELCICGRLPWEELNADRQKAWEEVFRLRGLIGDAEWTHVFMGVCPWCDGSGTHRTTCPAFVEIGRVR